jgi:23S rRNA (adenine1618-N6)-methyltransferase
LTNPRQTIVRHATIAKEYLPFPSSYTITLPTSPTPTPAKEIITTQLSSLDLLRWTWDASHSSGVGEASQNVWKRAYRREYEKKKKQGVQAGEQGRKVVLAFRITVLAGRVVVEWLRGSDQVLWESFCGLVHRYFREK